MLRKTRTPQMIAAGLLILLALVLPAGCIMIPAAGQSPVPSPQIGQSGPVTPLPSLCTSVEVHSSPSDAFRLKILVKNSAGEPAPGARVFITFYNGDEPVQIWTDDHGYAIFELHDKELTLPNPHGRTSGTLAFRHDCGLAQAGWRR